MDAKPCDATNDMNGVHRTMYWNNMESVDLGKSFLYILILSPFKISLLYEKYVLIIKKY